MWDAKFLIQKGNAGRLNGVYTFKTRETRLNFSIRVQIVRGVQLVYNFDIFLQID